jgi:CSLREA domain-containing protein
MWHTRNLPPRPRSRRARPLLEVLEDRLTPRVFVVNTLADGAPAADGNLTLREAVLAASTDAAFGDALAGEASDQIFFTSDLTGGTILLDGAQGTLAVDAGDLAILGPGGGPAGITVDGQDAITVFRVGSSAGTVLLQDLTLTRGSGSGGGGLLNEGAATTLRNVIISNSEADLGGGVANTGTLTVERSRIVGNRAPDDLGGGILNSGGTLTVTETTLDANFASAGGGLANESDGDVTVRRSTVSNNATDGPGAGILNDSGTLQVFNSTLAFNRVGRGFGGAGGIGIEDGTVTVVQSTVYGNTGLSGELTGVGGIDNRGADTFTLANSIVARNVSDSGNPNVRGTINVDNDNFVGGDPLLGPLQDNGGPTLTLAPLPGSPVLDAGTNVFATQTGQAGGTALTTDQRGFTRIVGPAVDQGAVEVFAPETLTALQVAQDGTATTTVSTASPTTLTATVTGNASLPPTGTVDFFDGTTKLNAVPVVVDPTGKATFRVTFAQGTHTLRALFTPGPFAFFPSSSPDQTLTAQPPPPPPGGGGMAQPAASTTTVTPSTARTSTALPVTFTATVASANDPEGTVDFFNGGTKLNANPVPLSPGNRASFIVPGLPAGANTITARFTPAADSNALGSEGSTRVTARITSTIGAFGPTDDDFHLRNQNNPGFPDFSFAFGGPGFLPVTGNWTGDPAAIDLPGVAYPSPGGPLTWFLSDDLVPVLPNLPTFSFGLAGWVPLAGDWDGAGGPEGIGVYDPATSTFYLRNTPDAGPAQTVFTFGMGGFGMLPVAGDWDGDGTDTVGLFDPNTATWFLRDTNDPADGSLAASFAYGTADSLPVVGDWDGDGDDTVGIYRPDPLTGFGLFQLRNANTPGAPDVNGGAPIPFGLAGWLPLSGNWGPRPLFPLHAADGPGPGGPPLTPDALSFTVGAALERLAGAGADPTVLNALSRAEYVVADLPTGWLAAADPAAGRVIVSPDAAGHGWFIDPTPWEDTEFAGPVAGVDLLSALFHEMGHLAGQADDSGPDLLAGSLPAGMRRADALDVIFGEMAV